MRCPNCDYDVRASVIWRNTIRCPECGIVVSLYAIAAHMVRQRRRAQAMCREVAAVLGMMTLVLLLHIVLDSSSGWEHLQSRIVQLASETSTVAIVIATGMMFTATCIHANASLRGSPLVFVAVALLILLALPVAIVPIVLLLWLMAFQLRCGIRSERA